MASKKGDSSERFWKAYFSDLKVIKPQAKILDLGTGGGYLGF